MTSLGKKDTYPSDMPVAAEKPSEPKVRYPSFTIRTDKDLGLPDVGCEFTVTIKAKKISERVSSEEDSYDDKYSCEIEVQEMGESTCLDEDGKPDDMPAGEKIKSAMRKKLGKEEDE
jgi:hypothetical protein